MFRCLPEDVTYPSPLFAIEIQILQSSGNLLVTHKLLHKQAYIHTSTYHQHQWLKHEISHTNNINKKKHQQQKTNSIWINKFVNNNKKKQKQKKNLLNEI